MLDARILYVEGDTCNHLAFSILIGMLIFYYIRYDKMIKILIFIFLLKEYKYMEYKKNLKRIGQIIFVLVSIVLFSINIDLGELTTGVVDQQFTEGEVISVDFGGEGVQNLEILLQSGENVSVVNDSSQFANEKKYALGDNVVLDQYQERFYIIDYVRRPALIILFGLLLALVLITNRAKGITSLLSIGFSFLVLFKLVLPLLLRGADPVLTALLGSLLIIPSIFCLSHGFNRKTSIAMAGTLITLVITGLLATIFDDLAYLSGIATEEAGFLKVGLGENINFRGLLLAGIIISILGVLDDVTITQASVVEQLKASKKGITFNELYSRSMTVGRDHIASVVNTLILVYAGASLPLLLLFMDTSQGIGQIVNLEFVAEEIVRTLIGSIGLVLAVPITTLLASIAYNKIDNLEPIDNHGHSH